MKFKKVIKTKLSIFEKSSFIIASFFCLMTLICCGGGGGGVSTAFSSGDTTSGTNISNLGWGGNGGKGSGISSGDSSESSPFFSTFPDLPGVDTVDITIVINGTTYSYPNLTKDSTIDSMPEISVGDIVSGEAVLNMVSDESRVTSIEEHAVTPGENPLRFATPYKLTYDITNAFVSDYGVIPTADELSVSVEQGFYSSAGCTFEEINIPGYKIEKWVLADGSLFTPGITKGDVEIYPVFKIDYTANSLPGCAVLPITSQKDFTDLIENHSNENFQYKTIKLYTDVTAHKSLCAGIFRGNFEGEKHTVTLNISSSNSGQFGFVEENNGTIKDTKFAGSVTGDSNSGETGAICGINYGTISNCSSTATIYSNVSFSGGLVGKNRKKISECYFNGIIENGTGYAGGICGHQDVTDASITNCYSQGSISAIMAAGGITGSIVGGLVSNCYSKATITGNYKGFITGNGSIDVNYIRNIYRHASWDNIDAITGSEISGPSDDNYYDIVTSDVTVLNSGVWNTSDPDNPTLKNTP